jgi:adenylylsulfate kinase-like enzyme
MATCLWLTGRAGTGKSTIARAVAEELGRAGVPMVLVDDEARLHLAEGPGPMVWLAQTLNDAGVTAIVAADLTAREDRDAVREAVGHFVEVFVDGGEAVDDGEYEEPFAPELRVPTHDRGPSASIALVMSWLEHEGVLEAKE